MVEFDVVLTKDKVPIVYHDFVFCIDQQYVGVKKAGGEEEKKEEEKSNKLLSLAVNQLTYEEVKENKVRNMDANFGSIY
jgi:glycerophosphoryl diester phosphodiesterase